LRHHGAVQIEIDRIERSEPAQILVEQRPHFLVGVLSDVGRRRRGRPGQRYYVVAELGQALDGAGDRHVEAFDAGDHLRPAQQRRPGVGAHELAPRRLLGRKGIGLVLKAADGDTRHEISPYFFSVASSMARNRTGQYSSPWPSSTARSISSRTTSAPSAGTPRSSAIWMA